MPGSPSSGGSRAPRSASPSSPGSGAAAGQGPSRLYLGLQAARRCCCCCCCCCCSFFLRGSPAPGSLSSAGLGSMSPGAGSRPVCPRGGLSRLRRGQGQGCEHSLSQSEGGRGGGEGREVRSRGLSALRAAALHPLGTGSGFFRTPPRLLPGEGPVPARPAGSRGGEGNGSRDTPQGRFTRSRGAFSGARLGRRGRGKQGMRWTPKCLQLS
ncbi:translation initiation factor IF-2-like [Monodelphis domestica]|uniref:translation initiation factor IF-2-like n=1 Tax=Monodelphis domestica TaxID=13616 RepID=UPI00044331CD|nr:translation initiation factor IF-2-like [Monodelphis domestica]